MSTRFRMRPALKHLSGRGGEHGNILQYIHVLSSSLATCSAASLFWTSCKKRKAWSFLQRSFAVSRNFSAGILRCTRTRGHRSAKIYSSHAVDACIYSDKTYPRDRIAFSSKSCNASSQRPVCGTKQRLGYRAILA